MGAVPFLTAAQMIESKPIRWVLYAASALTAWSRVNDDKHYVSQAALGWYMAWRAVRSVEGSEQQGSTRIDILPMGDGAGLMISGRF